MRHLLPSPLQNEVSPVVLGSQIQGRQLETPLSTADSSEGVGPKAACTLGSVGLGCKASPLFILHICSLLEEPCDLNQNLMSQLAGSTQMDGNDECTNLAEAVGAEDAAGESLINSL